MKIALDLIIAAFLNSCVGWEPAHDTFFGCPLSGEPKPVLNGRFGRKEGTKVNLPHRAESGKSAIEVKHTKAAIQEARWDNYGCFHWDQYW